jgi:hypothetical protein
LSQSKYGRTFEQVYGVDFSGARLAGRTTWVARIERFGRARARPRHRLVELAPLQRLAGTAERGPALAHLVALIRASSDALWALDFPFGLPIELAPAGEPWAAQLRLIKAFSHDDYGLGLDCVRRARALGGPMHIRRLTDVDARAPFDPYHYRIIYQTFYGMRDVLGPLHRRRCTAVLPFHYRRYHSAERVLVEACPASTLKRLRLPHQNYKQPAGGPLTSRRRRTRRAIVDGLARYVDLDASHQRAVMRDPGGDALDAIIAALGAAQAVRTLDHARIATHERYPREGHLYF